MGSIQRGGKNNPYNGNFNNDNNDIPSRKNDNSRLRKDGIKQAFLVGARETRERLYKLRCLKAHSIT